MRTNIECLIRSGKHKHFQINGYIWNKTVQNVKTGQHEMKEKQCLIVNTLDH